MFCFWSTAPINRKEEFPLFLLSLTAIMETLMFINCSLKMFSINCMFITSGTCYQIFHCIFQSFTIFILLKIKSIVSGILFISKPLDFCISGETWRPLKAVNYCTGIRIEQCRCEHSLGHWSIQFTLTVRGGVYFYWVYKQVPANYM